MGSLNDRPLHILIGTSLGQPVNPRTSTKAVRACAYRDSLRRNKLQILSLCKNNTCTPGEVQYARTYIHIPLNAVNESFIMGQADRLVSSGLFGAGYDTVIVDGEWRILLVQEMRKESLKLFKLLCVPLNNIENAYY